MRWGEYGNMGCDIDHNDDVNNIKILEVWVHVNRRELKDKFKDVI